MSIDQDSLFSIRNNPKLVIFIGAGVSANSGFCSWNNLVHEMDTLMGYNATVPDKYSNDELLRIPQYFYQWDKPRYENLLVNKFSCIPDKPNPIIDLILDLAPKHIITTNFDCLVEFSLKERQSDIIKKYITREYGVINKESVSVKVSKSHENLLIKMHGDTDSIDRIVLKEDDYLSYSENFPLIETFIKSLLIDHTFVFIGYGLNDNNFKQIMRWVETAISKNQGPSTDKRFHYYIHSDIDPMSQYDRNYYENKHVKIIDESDLPEDYSHWKISYVSPELSSLVDERGKKLYRIIKYIVDTEVEKEISFEDIYEIFLKFETCPKLILSDLLSLFEKRNAFHGLIDKTLYYLPLKFPEPINIILDSFSNLSSCQNPKLALIESVLVKSGVASLESLTDSSVTKLSYEFAYPSWYEYMLSHDISGMKKQMATTQYDIGTKVYLNLFLGENDIAEAMLDELNNQTNNMNILQKYSFLFSAMQLNSAKYPRPEKFISVLPASEKKSYATLVDFSDGFVDFSQYLNSVVLEIKLQNSPYRNSKQHGMWTIKERFKSLSTQLKNIFDYLVCNNVLIYSIKQTPSYHSSFSELIYQYIDAKFFLVSSCNNPNDQDIYEFSIYDLLFIIIFINQRDLMLIIRQYYIKKIALSKECQNFITTTLCNITTFQLELLYAKQDGLIQLSQRISTICDLLSVCELAIEYKRIIANISHRIFTDVQETETDKHWFVGKSTMFMPLLELVFRWTWDTEDHELLDIMKNVYLEIINKFNVERHDMEFSNVYTQLIDKYDILLNISNLLNKCKIVVDGEDVDRFISIAQKCTSLYDNRLLVDIYLSCNNSQKQLIKQQTLSNRLHLQYHTLFTAIKNSIIDYDQTIEDKLLRDCDRVTKVKSYGYRNDLSNPLYTVLTLYTNDLIPSVKNFERFAAFYPLFNFVCFPENFDYSKFDVFKWHELINSPKIFNAIQDVQMQVLKDKFREAMSAGSTEEIRAIYYKFFYSSDGELV